VLFYFANPSISLNNANVRYVSLRSWCIGAGVLACLGRSTLAGVILSEDFSEGWPPSGWVVQNNSNPIGSDTWALGAQDTMLTSPTGNENFASVNYESAGYPTTSVPTATASNWLIAPAVTFDNGDVASFLTSSFNELDNSDRLQLRLNLANTGTNVGTTATSVGDFGTLLLDINPTYATGDLPPAYPVTWTNFTATITGLSGPTAGRLAFRYFVEDSGPLGSNGNEIGIDDVLAETAPEPGSAAMCAVALALGLTRRLRRRPRSSG
jgi:hypothetical protein